MSIIIPAYNAERTIGHVLESIINQTYSNVEVIVVNNGSVDNTAKIIEEYKPKFLAKGYMLKHIEVPRPLGHAPAINEGLKRASGKYILILHSDVALGSSDWIETMVNELKHNSKVAVTSSLLITKPEELSFINRVFAYIYILGWHDYVKLPKMYVNYTGLNNDLIRAEVFNEVGLLDETYKYGTHDIVFSEMVRRRGYLILLNPEVYAKHLLSYDQTTLRGHIRKLWQYGFPSPIVLMRFRYLPNIDNLLFALSFILSITYIFLKDFLTLLLIAILMLLASIPLEPPNYYGSNKYARKILKMLANAVTATVAYFIYPGLALLGLGSGVILYRAVVSSINSWRRFRDLKLSLLVFIFSIVSSFINGTAVLAGLIYWPIKGKPKKAA